MKKALRFFLPLFIFICLVGGGIGVVHGGEPLPEPRGFVNDFANIIPDDVEKRIEQTLRDYRAKTTNEITVVTVTSLNGESIEQYTIRLAEKWKVGKKGKDNGVILLIAKEDRKLRIEVGYGLEGVLTDAKAKLIIERVIAPEFKQGNFVAGIEKGVAQIMKTLTPEDSASNKSNAQNSIEQTKANEVKKKDSNALRIVGVVVSIFVGVILMAVFILLIVHGYKKVHVENMRRKQVRVEASDIIARIGGDPLMGDKR